MTVAIITRNRSDYLKLCLKSLVHQTIPADEVLVIDNASTDSTKETVAQFKDKLPIRYFYEKEIGIPYARNRALKEARGDIIAFTDDDCEADSNWVQEMVKAHKVNPKAAAIMGSPICIPENGILSELDQVYHSVWIDNNTDKENIIFVFDTKNVSIKKKYCRGILFDTSFTRGSDVDFGQQILNRGGKIVFHSKSIINFRTRNNIIGFLIMQYHIGVSHARFDFKWGHPLNSINRGHSSKSQLTFRNSVLLSFTNFLAEYVKNIGSYKEILSVYYNYRRLEKEPELEIKLKNKKNTSRKRKIRLSIMIITKDRYDQLNKCLISLSRQTRKPDQVVIVDSSIEKKPNFVKKFKMNLPIKYISETRVGFGVQRNIALDHAVGDFGAIIDDDSVARKDWCEKIITAHNNYPKAVAIQGRIKSHSSSFKIKSFEQARRDAWILRNLDYDGRLSILTGNNSSYKLSLLKKYRISFAEDVLHNKYDGEDVDLAYQILLNDQIILLVPNIVVKHFERTTVISFLKQRYRVGCSSTIISRDWSHTGIIKGIFRRRIKGFLGVFQNNFFRIVFHPAFKMDFFQIVASVPLYFMTSIAYLYGVNHINRIFKNYFVPPYYILKHKSAIKLESLTVIVVASSKTNKLEKCLLSLARQPLQPIEVIVLDFGTNENANLITNLYRQILPITYVKGFNVSYSKVINGVLRKAKGKIVAIVDDLTIASPDWSFRIIEAHQKYPDVAAIQGWSYRLHKYGDLLSQNGQRHPKIKFLDNTNVSYKLSKLRKLNLWYRALDLDNSDFAHKLISKKQEIRFYPKVFVINR